MKEFKLTPTEASSPFNIDGDPHDYCPVHLKVLNRALSVFTLPEQGDHTVHSKVTNAPTAVALGIAGFNPSDLRPAAQPEGETATAALVKGLLAGGLIAPKSK